MNWELSPRPAELIEQRLINAIVDGDFPINSTLPPERELAPQAAFHRSAQPPVLRDGNYR